MKKQKKLCKLSFIPGYVFISNHKMSSYRHPFYGSNPGVFILTFMVKQTNSSRKNKLLNRLQKEFAEEFEEEAGV